MRNNILKLVHIIRSVRKHVAQCGNFFFFFCKPEMLKIQLHQKIFVIFFKCMYPTPDNNKRHFMNWIRYSKLIALELQEMAFIVQN